MIRNLILSGLTALTLGAGAFGLSSIGAASTAEAQGWGRYERVGPRYRVAPRVYRHQNRNRAYYGNRGYGRGYGYGYGGGNGGYRGNGTSGNLSRGGSPSLSNGNN